MDRSKIKQNISTIILIVVVVFTLFLWVKFFVERKTPGSAGELFEATESSTFVLIETVKRLKLDISVLSDSRFGDLEDFVGIQAIPRFEKGRTNPFASFK